MYETLDGTDRDVLGFGVHDEVRTVDVRAMLDRMEAAIAGHDGLNVLVRLDSLPGFEFGALDENVGFWLEHRNDVDRYAVVTDDSLIRGWSRR